MAETNYTKQDVLEYFEEARCQLDILTAELLTIYRDMVEADINCVTGLSEMSDTTGKLIEARRLLTRVELDFPFDKFDK